MEPAWRGVSADDADGLFELERAVKRTDGPETVSDLVEDALAADVAVCASARDRAIIGVGFVRGTTLGGTVHPDYRRCGVGTHLLEWAEEHAPGDAAELTIRNEALTVDAHAIYVSRGFEQQFVEDAMVRHLGIAVGEIPLPADVELVLPWSRKTAALFFAAYRASFADRPGFREPPGEEWVDDHDREEFRRDLSLIALAGGEPVGFLTVELDPPAGWIDQMGVVPTWRRRGLGAALIAQTLRRFQAEGLAEALLHVNTNNPGAAALYERLGFRKQLQRARYVKSRH